jgi:DNA-binding NtrC family response regulator
MRREERRVGNMKTILQIEYRHSTLQLREEILQGPGHPITSVLGNPAARRLDLDDSIGVVVIGHGAPWRQRLELIEYFRATLPHVPVVALLRRTDVPFQNSTHNCPADNPVAWVRIVANALTAVQ